jgi:hypothetical protein
MASSMTITHGGGGRTMILTAKARQFVHASSIIIIYRLVLYFSTSLLLNSLNPTSSGCFSAATPRCSPLQQAGHRFANPKPQNRRSETADERPKSTDRPQPSHQNHNCQLVAVLTARLLRMQNASRTPAIFACICKGRERESELRCI